MEHEASPPPLKLVYFSKFSDIGPSSRYRIYQFLPFLEAAGITCVVHPLFGATYFKILEIRVPFLRVVAKVVYAAARFVKRGMDLLAVSRTDLIVIECQLFPYLLPAIERLLAVCHRRFVIEFDDAVYLTKGHGKKMPVLLKRACAVIVGNDHLARYASLHSERIRVVPTVVDTERFDERRCVAKRSDHSVPEPVTIVWMGLAYNFPYLNPLIPALKHLQAVEGVRFRVVSSHPPVLPGVDVEFRPWSFDSEVTELQTSHVGVMPLPDDEWARGKCGLKVLQYMAIGIPAVASPVGCNQDIICHGENGFLARSEEEWINILSQLCRDSDLRARIGRAGRKTVQERFSLHVWAPRLVDHYRQFRRG